MHRYVYRKKRGNLEYLEPAALRKRILIPVLGTIAIDAIVRSFRTNGVLVFSTQILIFKVCLGTYWLVGMLVVVVSTARNHFLRYCYCYFWFSSGESEAGAMKHYGTPGN